MIKPEKPANEAARLSALRKLNILDTPLNSGFERITRLTKTMFNVPMVAVSLVDEDRQWFKAEQGLNACETSREISFCGHAILQDEFFVVPNASQDERFKDNPLVKNEPHIMFYAGYPIRTADGFKIGSFCIMDHKPRNITLEELAPLKDMVGLVEQQINSSQQLDEQASIIKELDKVKREKLIDTLTRVWNREGIELNFQRIASTAKQQKLNTAITIIDIDDFKKINDTYGHNAGDYVLREVTKRLVSALSNRDIVGRWGGEEFLGIMVLKCDDAEEAYNILDKARKTICQDPIEYQDNKIRVSASFGITFTKEPEVNLIDLVERADHALYEAKNSGKNKCILET